MRHYTIKDIKEFMEITYPEIKWDGLIIDKSDNIRPISEQDLNLRSIVMYTTLMQNEDYITEVIAVSPSNTNFSILDSAPTKLNFNFAEQVTQGKNNNFQGEWINLLLKNHKDEYAKFLTNYASSQKRKIREIADKNIENYIKSTNKNAENEFKIYDNYLQKANKVLSENKPTELGEE